MDFANFISTQLTETLDVYLNTEIHFAFFNRMTIPLVKLHFTDFLFGLQNIVKLKVCTTMKAPLALLFSFLGGKFGGSSLYARTLMFGWSCMKLAIVRTIEWPLPLSIVCAEGPQTGLPCDCIIFVCKTFGVAYLISIPVEIIIVICFASCNTLRPAASQYSLHIQGENISEPQSLFVSTTFELPIKKLKKDEADI
ncbi:hypothetical protein T08_11219 [Trichinella sp. T8]|nr:hypothetical protein T08_11219 [Trichinella sp. T8]